MAKRAKSKRRGRMCNGKPFVKATRSIDLAARDRDVQTRNGLAVAHQGIKNLIDAVSADLNILRRAINPHDHRGTAAELVQMRGMFQTLLAVRLLAAKAEREVDAVRQGVDPEVREMLRAAAKPESYDDIPW